MTKLEHPLHLMIRYVDPDRVLCPVSDCTNEGDENALVEVLCSPQVTLRFYLCMYHNQLLQMVHHDGPARRGMICLEDLHVMGVSLEQSRTMPPPAPGPYEVEDEPEKDGGPPVRPGEAGALFAFMGWLTSRKEVSGPFSGHHEAGQGAQLVGRFIEMQGWQEPPDGWWHSIKPYTEEEKEALGQVHMENYRTRMDLEPVSSLEDISYRHAPLEEV
jgi:hypothetical protein